MHGSFNVGQVEVDASTCGRVDEFGGEAEDVPRQGTYLGDFVDVEAGLGSKAASLMRSKKLQLASLV